MGLIMNTHVFDIPDIYQQNRQLQFSQDIFFPTNNLHSSLKCLQNEFLSSPLTLNGQVTFHTHQLTHCKRMCRPSKAAHI